jgi:hypothetical protein
VPAPTFWVSANFALANFLASRSFGNVSVILACFRFRGGSYMNTTLGVRFWAITGEAANITVPISAQPISQAPSAALNNFAYYP